MKKLLMGIFGLMLLLPLGVFAEEDYTPTPDIDSVEEDDNWVATTVTIGTVETPVYEVYMIWGDSTFNWTYNKKTGVYNWEPAPQCSLTTPEEALSLLATGTKIYSDNRCLNEVSTEDYSEEYAANYGYYYYQPREAYDLVIEDRTQNGRIVASVKWTSADKYNYVEGKLSYRENAIVCELLEEQDFNDVVSWNIDTYTDNNCINKLEDTNVEFEENAYYAKRRTTVSTGLTTEELPDTARLAGFGGSYYVEDEEEIEIDYTYARYYYIQLKLENKEKPTSTPTAGDILGAITISIRAAE